MAAKAKDLKASDPRPFSVAVATIGVFGYDLLGHDIIDMVGLTDSTIARYSEPPIPGMETTWKEQKHNTKYILQRQPDYIMFSTGIKPSAPAERALLLYRQFIESYRTVGWYYQRGSGTQGVISSVFKRVRPVEGELVPYYSVEYVQEYKTALDAYSRGDHKTALQHYEAALRASAKPYNPYLLYQMAFSLQVLGDYDKAFGIYQALVAQDTAIFEPHLELYRRAAFIGDSVEMAVHKKSLQTLVPWYWPRFEAVVQESLRRAR
jgi:tetratricopeptide (TPR) repeat protein